ncbi:MAG: hypothetical protein JWO57_3788 [Pseudonocardiales bacterium]|nr:hypothetical protein [Pseudonocardiales bacterium]
MRERRTPRHAANRAAVKPVHWRLLWDRTPVGRLRRRPAAGIALLAGLSLVGAVVSVATFVGMPAQAAATAVSTFTKTATDQTNNSTASSATGTQGTASPGDTVKWVLNYTNNTGATANVNITDPITGSQTYVANSLQTPPSLTGSVNGSTVSATGSVPGGTTAAQSPFITVNPVTFVPPGGDGYSVEGLGNNIYTVFHHSHVSTTVYCSTLTGDLCPGWTAQSSYVNPTAGTPLGTGGVGPYTTAGENGSFIASGKLYWGVESQVAVNGQYAVGVQCLDLTTLLSCGFTQLDTQTVQATLPNRVIGMISSNGVPAANGNYYFFDGAGNMLCFSPTAGACGQTNISGGRNAGYLDNLTGVYYNASILTADQYVYVTFVDPDGTLYLSCYNTATPALCAPSFPINEGTPADPRYPDFIAPVLSTSGTLLGACDVYLGACYSPTGASMPTNPYAGFTSMGCCAAPGFGDGAVVGSRWYAGNGITSRVLCWDFAAWTGTGVVPLCSGFSGPRDSTIYTVRPLANLPGCMAANGNDAQIVIFNAQTGGTSCASASQSVKLTPSDYYCDGHPGHATTWGTVSMTGLTGSEYASATVTLLGADGTPVPNWTNVPFPSGSTSIDISSLPVSGNTATLTAQVNLVAVSNIPAVQAARVQLSWVGDGIQVCYQTVLPPVPCLQTVPVSNTANAVTTAGAVTDAPAGNSSGAAVFDVTQPAAACMLHFAKTASPSTASPDQVVTYTIVVHNTGTADFAAANPATFTDDLTDTLADSTYANDASASAGTVTYSAATHVLSWSGPLAAGATATVTYTVTVNNPDAGDKNMVNRVVSPNPSNCLSGSADPACVAVVPITIPHVFKSSNPADGSTVTAGQVITYTLTFANPDTGRVQVSYTDDLSKMLDDATVTSAPTASNRELTVSAISGGQFTVTGAVPGNTTYTVMYQATVKPDGQRGDNDLGNFLVPTGTTPPATCQVGDPLCTEHFVPEIVAAKSVNPTSGTTVVPGQVLTYTMTFQNVGAATGTISYVDHLGDVLDDATITTAPSSPNLTVGAVAGDQFTVTGPIPAGATYTVTYQVTVNPAAQQGNYLLANFVTEPGVPPPTQCVAGDPLCTVNPVRGITNWKTVNPASGTPVVAGQSLTYTLHFTNTGTAGGNVNTVDDITQAIDDASVTSQPVSSDQALSVTSFGTDNRAHITGTLQPGQTVTITYTLTVHAANHLGDSILANFLLKPTDPPPTSPKCTPTDPQKPDCTSNPIGTLTVAKTVNPANFSQVKSGDTLTYTLTFHNVGKGAVGVDYTDHVAGVLDDADLTSEPTASDNALSTSAVTGAKFRVTGTLAGGQTVTVTYQVKVKPYAAQGDHKLDNFLAQTGHGIAAECVSADPLCTDNPVPPPAQPPLAQTGTNPQLQLALAGLLLGAGALLTIAGYRRRRS